MTRFTHEAGDLFNGVISVTATAHGIEGVDVLGGCHLNCYNHFNSTPFENDVDSHLNDHSMIDTAIEDLINQIKERAKALQPYIGV